YHSLARFIQHPEVTIKGDKAEIRFHISGPLTHIKVENCVEGTENCVTEIVKVPQKTRITREIVRTVYDFMTTVALVDSKVKCLLFSFWMYDGDVLLTSHPTVVKINKDNITVIIASIFGILFVIIIIIIPIILWRKGLLRRSKLLINVH
ncbi:hypothetical protein LSH36_2762g00000, partial [Paralvinella palmiformis]